MLSCNHKNAELSKCVLSLTLKTSTDVERLTSKGKAFKSLVAAQVKDYKCCFGYKTRMIK